MSDTTGVVHVGPSCSGPIGRATRGRWRGGLGARRGCNRTQQRGEIPAVVKSSSGAISSTLQLAIQHEADRGVSASGFIAGNPTAFNDQFGQWVASVQALKRYPELVGLGYCLRLIESVGPWQAVATNAHGLPAATLIRGPGVDRRRTTRVVCS
jgi:hypothetical protein